MSEEYRSARDLIDFVNGQMAMSGRYQPLMIKHLILSGGQVSKASWAKRVLETEPGLMEWAMRKAMRWPVSTLVRKRGWIRYDAKTKSFTLLVHFEDEREREAAIAACEARLREWSERHPSLPRARRYDILRRDGGRCLACGVTGSDAPLDVDHIVPKSRAKDALVQLATGETVGVDDPRNLQTLCARCNREKQDRGDPVDFRPSDVRLRESVEVLLKGIENLDDQQRGQMLHFLCDSASARLRQG